MSFKPNEITKENVLRAVEKIEDQKLELKPSTRWLVEINGKHYPPKEIMRFAHEDMNGEKSWEYGGGKATNKYLVNMDFPIIDKSSDLVKDMIEKYRNHIKTSGLNDEIYKWKTIAEFKGRPDPDSVDFYEEIRSVNFSNLIYPVGVSVIHHIAKERPNAYRECFKVLFDEARPLTERIRYFNEETLKIYRELVPEENLSHHQDERTISTFLTYHNPEKYTFYKASFYGKYCKLLGLVPKKKGEKFIHYLELIDDLISEYINEDLELLNLVKINMQGDCYEDSGHKILAQDILYQTLDKLTPTEEVVALMASDGTGWQDNHIHKAQNFETNILWNSKRPSGTRETLTFLRNIINEEETFNLYYSSGGNVNYKATIIDFVETQSELDKKAWNNQYNIMDYHEKFSDYVDENKSAKIIFLAKDLTKIKPIPVSKFGFYKSFGAPRQDNISPVKFEPTDLEIDMNNNSKTNNDLISTIALNQILYGPPGTGKTYTTINKAISIIDNKEESVLARSYRNRIDLKNRFNELLIEDWENPNGQIIFTTFHQSMSYEDFIEGIKPGVNDKQKVIYEVVPGIFKMIASIARDNWLDAHQGKIQQLSFEDAFSRLKEEWFENQDLKFPMKREGYDFTIIGFTKSSIQFKKASGGTGHTLSISTLREYFYNRREVRPTGVGIYYPPVLEKLKSFQPALKVEKKIKNYVLIIDEINRGNVSQIFGELITMIEDDKRLGKPEALEVMLPYSKEKFGVPPNLYIIGTMNTADRSVEALDAALRRRFYFEEMMPKPELIRPSVILQRLWIKYADLEWNDPNWLQVENDYLTFHGAKIIDRKKYEELENETDLVNYLSVLDNIIEYDGLNLELILTTINKRIEKLLDKDHQIGHSYFMSVVNLKDLRSAFQNKIVPLLQEYFFGDYGKIGLILGKGFFEPLVTLKDNLFADFDDYDASEFSERPIYKIKDMTNIPDIEFIDAINSLLKK